MPGADDPLPPSPSPARVTGPWTWTVTWGVLARPGFVVEHVTAWDADEALELATRLRPELTRPRVAFLTEPDPVASPEDVSDDG